MGYSDSKKPPRMSKVSETKGVHFKKEYVFSRSEEVFFVTLKVTVVWNRLPVFVAGVTLTKLKYLDKHLNRQYW